MLRTTPSWAALLVSVVMPLPAEARDGPSAQHLLQAASGSSPRPSECRSEGLDRSYTLWDRAKDPTLARYCDLLARGYARLAGDAAAAVAAAEAAAQLDPRRAAPKLLKARALVAQGSLKEAFEIFDQALKSKSELRLSPEGLHAYARAAAGSGNTSVALHAYRRLVPMASLLSGLGASECVYVEAAVLIMRVEPAQLQEAVAYLNEARRRNAIPSLRPFVLAALALALDRQGRPEEARGVASEAHGHTSLMIAVAEAPSASVPTRVPLPAVARVELLAMVAILAANDDVALAKEYWLEFSEKAPADHPWLAHARLKAAGKGG